MVEISEKDLQSTSLSVFTSFYFLWSVKACQLKELGHEIHRIQIFRQKFKVLGENK
jgi:hypothetical protein